MYKKKDIFHIDELSYFCILPNNNLKHIFLYLVIQKMDINSLYNNDLLVRKQNKQGQLGIFQRKFLSDHLHNILMDNL